MASIVKVPKNATADYDFVAFSFDGKHSYEDMGIIRTSGGDRFTMDLAPTMQDKTVEVPGGHGTYYFGTEFKKRDFRISFAFDDLTETKLAELKHWLKADKTADLWFAEAPYKVYTAKVTGQPNLKYIPFDNVTYTEPAADDETEEAEVVFKEITLTDKNNWQDKIVLRKSEIPQSRKVLQVWVDAVSFSNEAIATQSPGYREGFHYINVSEGGSAVDNYYTVDEEAQETTGQWSWDIQYDLNTSVDRDGKYKVTVAICYIYKKKQRISNTVYKGEGEVTLTAYYPFAHTPDEIHAWNEEHQEYEYNGHGLWPNAYKAFPNYERWIESSGLTSPDLANMYKQTAKVIFCGVEDITDELYV